MHSSEYQCVLKVDNLCRKVRDSEGSERQILAAVSFTVTTGDILFVRGPSGVGKTLLLRSLALLDPVQGGSLQLNGQAPLEIGVTQWRSVVTYVPQARVQPKGTPAELYFAVQQFKAQKGRPRRDLPTLVQRLGLEQGTLNQQWSQLSGGQAQRMVLAIATALRPDVLLLDEPTSALDLESAKLTEAVLQDCGAACIWVSHDSRQLDRVGGRILDLPSGRQSSMNPTEPAITV